MVMKMLVLPIIQVVVVVSVVHDDRIDFVVDGGGREPEDGVPTQVEEVLRYLYDRVVRLKNGVQVD